MEAEEEEVVNLSVLLNARQLPESEEEEEEKPEVGPTSPWWGWLPGSGGADDGGYVTKQICFITTYQMMTAQCWNYIQLVQFFTWLPGKLIQ